MKKALIIWMVFFGLVIFGVATAEADVNATLAWDANDPSESVTEYRLYYDTDQTGEPYTGTGLNEGDSHISIPVSSLADPNNPEFTVTDLSAGQTYWFVLTAFNGNESGYSNEVSLAVPDIPDAPINMTITIQITIN